MRATHPRALSIPSLLPHVRFVWGLLVAGMLTLLAASPAAAEDAELNQLAASAQGILKKYCYGCHGIKQEVFGLDVLDREKLVRKRVNAPSYVNPGDPDSSLLLQRMTSELAPMPPEEIASRPSPAEIETIRQWVTRGAPEAKQVSRPPVDERHVLEAILTHLSRLNIAEKPHFRYLSLANVHNDPLVKDEDLRLYRAGVVKLLNSVSRSPEILQPRLIDAPPQRPLEGVVFAIDLRQLGWDRNLWLSVLKEYPYGLTYNNSELRGLVQSIEQLMGEANFDGVPYVRADWFVKTASQPQHYHRLLGLPTTIAELERQLGVDVAADFRDNRMMRAALGTSGVSKHNRLIDRHVGRGSGATGYYYRSYDFGKSFGRAVLFRFPLGPRDLSGNAFGEQAGFEADGGEIIWQLPNGFQGYLIIDGQGQRIDRAPVDIVRDLTETAGSPVVNNGISCLGCHKTGMQSYENALLEGAGLAPEARDKVDLLYRRPEDMNQVVEADRQKFSQTVLTAIGPYLQINSAGVSASEVLAGIPEPISTLVRYYDRDMGPEQAAAELGFNDTSRLSVFNQKLQELGLVPLAQGKRIPRQMWDTLEESSASVFQRAALALGVGSGRQPVQVIE
jgi:mono/diheme cytochrome c family protein